MGILVTGASSVLGRALVKALVSSGHEVTAFVRSSRRIAQLPAHIRIVYGDIRNSEALKAAMRGASTVFHMAGMMRDQPRDSKEYEEINVNGLKESIRLAGECGADRFIYTGSFFALGPSTGHALAEADSRKSFDFLGDFDRSVTLADRVARAHSQKGFPIVTVYPGLMYGPGEPPKGYGVAARILEFLQGRPASHPSDMDRVCSYTFIEDIAQGHVYTMEKATMGGVYILGGENITLKRLYELLSQVTDLPIPPSTESQWKIMLRRAAKNLIQDISGKASSTIPEEIEMLKYNWALSSIKAFRELNYTITPIREGLIQTVNWLRENILQGSWPRA
jgi:farnesol dehydrogenase